MCVWNRKRIAEWRRTFMSFRFEGEVFDGFFTVKEKMKNVKMQENHSKIHRFFEGENGRPVTEKKSKTLAGCWGLFCCGKKIFGARKGETPTGAKKDRHRQAQTDTDAHRQTHSFSNVCGRVWVVWVCGCVFVCGYQSDCVCVCVVPRRRGSILPVPSTRENIMCSLFLSSLLAPCLNVQVFALMRPNTLRECQ